MPTDAFYKFGYILPHGHCYTCDWPQPAQPITFLDSTQSPGMPCACRLQILWKCNFFLLVKIWNQLSKCLHSAQPSANLGEHQLLQWCSGCSSIRVWCCNLPWMPPHAFQPFTCSVPRPIMTSTTSHWFKALLPETRGSEDHEDLFALPGVTNRQRGYILHAIYNPTL